MRFFKKEGRVKFRKTDDSEIAKKCIEEGFEECDSSGIPVSSKSKKKGKNNGKET
tara:strand:- start:218 stop:382 length:165 start_codon:yes stop_codon:yes gene_type:complete